MVGHDCFIAHASVDGPAARALATHLAGRRTVFLAQRDLASGSWDEAIAQAQRNAAATIVLLSRDSTSAYYLMEEIAAAVELHRQGAHRIVPVALEPLASNQIPYGLLRLQRVTHEADWDRTVGAIEQLLERPGGPGRAARENGIARLQWRGPDGRPHALELRDGDAVTLGRGPACTLRFDDAAISTVHAELRLDGGVLSVRDLGSKNGSFVDGRAVRAPRVLRAGDCLRLGPRGPEILVVDTALPPTATATAPDARP